MRFRLPNKLVYWPPTGADEFGRPTLGTPVEYCCRWEDCVEETIDPNGDVVLSSAVAYLTDPAAVAGVMWHGTLIEGPQSSSWLPDVKSNFGTHEIINVSKIPGLRGQTPLTKVSLK
jgi:hypothetical protein